jgi:hypothetical protein
MTYKQFFDWCNERACDGMWGLYEALVCTDVINKIESVKVSGFHFRKKKLTEQARENAWIKLNSKWRIEEIINATNKKIVKFRGMNDD